MTNGVLGANRVADVALACHLVSAYLAMGVPGDRGHGAGVVAGPGADSRPRAWRPNAAAWARWFNGPYVAAGPGAAI